MPPSRVEIRRLFRAASSLRAFDDLITLGLVVDIAFDVAGLCPLVNFLPFCQLT